MPDGPYHDMAGCHALVRAAWPPRPRRCLPRFVSMAFTKAGGARAVALHAQPVLGRRPRHVPLASERRPHRPGTRLHHHFRNIPQPLELRRLPHVFHPKELVESHGGHPSRRRDVEKRRGERAAIVSAHTDPLRAGVRRAPDADRFAPLPIGKRRAQLSQRPRLEGLRPVQGLERMRQVERRVPSRGRNQPRQPLAADQGYISRAGGVVASTALNASMIS